MELRHLRVLLALAEELHFGRSAIRLHVAQSAVSQSIRDLEEEIGTKLFDRTKRRVRLTPAGASFIVHAQRALNELELGKVAARSAGSGESGNLCLSFSPMAALTELPKLVEAYQRQFPGVRLRIQSLSSSEQLQAIRERRCDIGFMPRATARAACQADRALAARPLEESPLLVVLRRKHPLTRQRSVQLGALADVPMVFLRQRDEPQVNQAFRRRCEAAGFEPRVVVEVEDVESVFGFVAAGVGVACMPGIVRRLSFPGVTTIELSPTIPTGIWAVWYPEAMPSTASRFLDVLQAALDAPHATPKRSKARSK